MTMFNAQFHPTARDRVSPVNSLISRAVQMHREARSAARPLLLRVPAACSCGRELRLDLAAQFDLAAPGEVDSSRASLLLYETGGDRRLELCFRPAGSPDPGLQGLRAPGYALVEIALDPERPLAPQVFREDGSLRGARAWSSWPVPCPHGLEVPVIGLGKRAIPAWCARTRFTGELVLLAEPGWPATEACERCPWYRGAAGAGILCAAPEVERERHGLCLEVDIYREDGRKRRSFVPLEGDVPAAVRRLVHHRGASRARKVDVKFVAGEAARFDQEPDTFMERWRYYWDGEKWREKPPGAPLHDWNKWGRNLEFVSASEPGGLPPEGGWPPVLDLPEGTYALRILEVGWKTGRRGEPELEWAFRVLKGPARGRRVFRRSPVRTPAMQTLVARDLAMVLERLEQDIVLPGVEGFDAQLEQVRGIAVVGRVAMKDAFTNLYLIRRAVQRRGN